MNTRTIPQLLAVSLFVAQAAFAQVTLCGSGTVGRVIKPLQAEVEAKSGQKIELTLKNSLLGLKDLDAGTTQLAMISAPVKEAAEAAEIPSATLQAFTLAQEDVSFIINPANPVEKLTAAQVRDIFTGKITNWQTVGGKDEEIKIFILDNNNGPRLAAKQQMFASEPMAVGTTERSKSGDIVPIVSQLPNAISFIGSNDVKPTVKVVENQSLKVPLNIVSKGEPTAEQKAVIDAIKAALTK